jgi:outer membrane protein TolC
MKTLLLILIFLLKGLIISAQDSSYVLTEEKFIPMILYYHPVAKQAGLVIERGEYGLKRARGKFDPYLFASYDEKQFDDKDYFSILGTGLNVPTWIGVDVKFGYDRNNGVFLNPENNVPDNGLFYAGVSLPVGEGLFIDERRKIVQQAKLFSEYTRAEQSRIMNDLLLEAYKNYWYWVKNYQQLRIYQESVAVARERFSAIKDSYRQGDKPAIDTLEAFIQLQNRQIGENQARIDYRNATLELSNFLWFDQNIPLEITDLMRPPSANELGEILAINETELQQDLMESESLHPELQLYQYKISDLNIEQRWKKEKIKPKLNLNYNFLNETLGSSPEMVGMNNYKWGLQFSMPLFLRAELGDLRLTQIKMREAEYNQSQKSLEVTNKILRYYQELNNLIEQRNIYNNNVNNYQRLLNAERRKFDAGESSLFLINSREVSLIEASIKLVEVEAKTRIVQKGYHWASGTLFIDIQDQNF